MRRAYAALRRPAVPSVTIGRALPNPIRGGSPIDFSSDTCSVMACASKKLAFVNTITTSASSRKWNARATQNPLTATFTRPRHRSAAGSSSHDPSPGRCRDTLDDRLAWHSPAGPYRAKRPAPLFCDDDRTHRGILSGLLPRLRKIGAEVFSERVEPVLSVERHKLDGPSLSTSSSSVAMCSPYVPFPACRSALDRLRIARSLLLPILIMPGLPPTERSVACSGPSKPRPAEDVNSLAELVPNIIEVRGVPRWRPACWQGSGTTKNF
jgi:hypothetical protein